MINTNKQKNLKYIDLHMHTTYSDGVNSPEDIVRFNALAGIDIMTVSDHDSTRGYARACVEAEKWGIKVIPGVELTTEKYHILGLGFDMANKEFQKYVNYSGDLQNRNSRLRAEMLAEHGVPISYEKMFKMFPQTRLGKFNFGLFGLRDPECREYVWQKYGKLNAREVMHKWLGRDGIAKDIDRRNADPEETIKAIKKAGGIAMIAHPSKDIDDMSEMDRLLSYGLDGLEVQPNFIETYPSFYKYAGEHGLLITYGSDYHGPGLPRYLLGRGINVMSEELEKRLF